MPPRRHAAGAPSLRLAALIATSLALSACSSSEPRATSASSAGPAEAPAAASGVGTVSGQAPPGAIVALEPVGSEPARPPGPVVMDQYSRAFIPDLLLVRVGQVVEFRNSEDVDHNVRVQRIATGATVMNESGSQNQVFKHTFDQTGSYEVSCDVHPGMRAIIAVTRTPFAVSADPRGVFTLMNVPDGTYVARVSGAGRETSQEIRVQGPTTEVNLTGR
ncbi:MAG: cupredoxin domain-containing protein [Acidobacteriota bacterium]